MGTRGIELASLDSALWHGRKVLVTGHTGFKGSWLTKVLELAGSQIAGYSLAPDTRPSHFESLKWQDLKHEIGDIRDREKVLSFVHEYEPEVIFHLAAQPLVLRSYHDPHYTYETNVMGTLNVLEAVRRVPSVKAVVIVTSDKCYENLETNTPYKESDPMGGYDPYSASKGCVEILTASYRQSYFNTSDYGKGHSTLIASVRAGNVIGGGDWSENRLIPDFARAFRDNRRVVLRSPKAVRPWQHVLEPVSGYLLLAEKLLRGQKSYARAYNFGPDPEGFWTVEQIVNLAKEIWHGFDYALEPAQRHEATLLMLDSSLAHAELSWRPRLTVEEAVEWTLGWYQKFILDDKVITQSQIEKFFGMS